MIANSVQRVSCATVSCTCFIYTYTQRAYYSESNINTTFNCYAAAVDAEEAKMVSKPMHDQMKVHFSDLERNMHTFVLLPARPANKGANVTFHSIVLGSQRTAHLRALRTHTMFYWAHAGILARRQLRECIKRAVIFIFIFINNVCARNCRCECAAFFDAFATSGAFCGARTTVRVCVCARVCVCECAKS